MAANGGRKFQPAKPGRGLLAVIVLLLVLAAVGTLVFFVFFKTKTVATITVQRGTVVRAFYATGVVRPDVEYNLKSRAQGTLLDMTKREGARVTKGELLARVDDRQLKYEVERLQAELKEAQAQAGDNAPQRLELLARINEAREQQVIADRTLSRILSNFEKGVASQTDVDNARRSAVQWSNAKVALESQLGTWAIESKKRVDVAEANLRKAQANLADSEVRSPVDGVILERFVENNEVVGINQRLLLVAAPDDKLMKASVDEEDITRTTVGQKVLMQLYAFQDRDDVKSPVVFDGKVVEILPSANPTNKTYEVKVAFNERPDRLKVGMTGELNFIESESERKAALIVPTSAVLNRKAYRPVGAGRFEPVDVVVGIRTLDKLEITNGLKEGDIIALDAKQVAPVQLPKTPPPVVPTRTGDDVAGK